MSVYEPNSRHLREVLIFQRFKNGDFDVEDRHSSGREKVFEDAELEALLE